MKTQLLLALYALFVFTSCKKENEAPVLTGEWQLSARFDGYANGGSFQWQEVPSAQVKTIRFNRDGSFTEQDPANSQLCRGSYAVDGSTLLLDSDCGAPVKLRLDRFTGTVMELAYAVREGQVIERYARK
jgi:hypothetical protein